MATIDVDFDVWQAIQIARKSEVDSASAVIRRALNLPDPPKRKRPWVTRHGTFHDGTPFRATYKGQEYRAAVIDGALEFEGERFKSPSAAARTITGSPVNGWTFWQFQYAGDEDSWYPLRHACHKDPDQTGG